ncbi:Auxin-induced protein [Musa troglodytarum]|uniref:Auxin-induced protein n=1 Tax=Musa troglodytarum TaxID=320322 RepID=A0A9E7FL99_9LILI|nr:Auxin-induced protein [Musa troglodytarum]
MMLGMKKTSPAIASAMSNLAPGLIFIVAVCLTHVAASIVSVPCSLEKFEVECWYSRAKVGGTFVCFSGAVAMSCFHSNSNSPNLTSKEPKLLMKHLDKNTYSDRILGCFYLLAAVVLQLQTANMMRFIFMRDNFCAGLCSHCTDASPNTRQNTWRSNGWCVHSITDVVSEQKRPFSCCHLLTHPNTLCSYSFSHPLQADHKFRKVGMASNSDFLYLVSTAGVVLMFVGLCIVLWAKSHESCSVFDVNDGSRQPVDDVEKPLVWSRDAHEWLCGNMVKCTNKTAAMKRRRQYQFLAL